MLKKIFATAVLLLAVLSFVVSLLGGNNNEESKVASHDRVAVITISGTIACGSETQDSLFGQAGVVTSGGIINQIREAGSDESVKALVLQIDSGGGSATAAEEVGRELLRFKEKTQKPVVTTLGNTGASAAYWIAACASDKIFANATTLTGSIGVYMPYMNTEELFKKIGIETGRIKSGPFKDIMSADRPMTLEEKLILQDIVNEIYNQFVAVVAAGRKMEEGQVRRLADGRIYTGLQAKNLGLIDEIGGYYDALAEAGKLAGIEPGKEGLPAVKEKAKPQPWELFLSSGLKELVLEQLKSTLLGDMGSTGASGGLAR